MLEIKMRRPKTFLAALVARDTFLYKRMLYMVCDMDGVLDTICLHDGKQYPLGNVKVELVDCVLTRL